MIQCGSQVCGDRGMILSWHAHDILNHIVSPLSVHLTDAKYHVFIMTEEHHDVKFIWILLELTFRHFICDIFQTS